MRYYRIRRYLQSGSVVDYGALDGQSQAFSDTLRMALDAAGYQSPTAGYWAATAAEKARQGKSMLPATFYGRVTVEDFDGSCPEGCAVLARDCSIHNG